MDEKQLVIMRGLPFAGKSYRAREIAGEHGVIFSTDEYWYTQVKPEEPNTYNFVPKFLHQAHKWNQLRAQRQFDLGHPLVIIDNTNCSADDFCCAYVKYAANQDYVVRFEEPTSDRWQEISVLLRSKKANKKPLKDWARKLAEGSQSTHCVPAWRIERMMWRWQPDLDPKTVLETCRDEHIMSWKSQ